MDDLFLLYMMNLFKTRNNYLSKSEDLLPGQRSLKTTLSGDMLYIIPMLLMFLVACKNKEEQLKCLEEEIVKMKRDNEYQDLKMAITDSIKNWTRQGLKYTRNYSDSISIWKVDEIVLNADKTRLFGWILKVKKTSDVDALDYVEYFAGEKKSEKWYFYVHHMPSIGFDREDNNNQPYSFEYLSKTAKEKVIRGGIINRWSCSINSEYINEWIGREGRDLYKWHHDFLRSSEGN